MKSLYVEFVNSYKSYMDRVYLDVATPASSRVVRIPLTDEQIAQLEPQQTGMDNGRPQYEDVRLICVQDDPA